MIRIALYVEANLIYLVHIKVAVLRVAVNTGQLRLVGVAQVPREEHHVNRSPIIGKGHRSLILLVEVEGHREQY